MFSNKRYSMNFNIAKEEDLRPIKSAEKWSVFVLSLYFVKWTKGRENVPNDEQFRCNLYI